MTRKLRSTTWFALAVLATAGHAAAAEAVSDGVVKLGVLTDMTGYYSYLSGPSSVLATRMAVADFGGKVLGKPIEVVSADHQNKADISANTALRWFDEEKVDTIVDLVSSSTALAAIPIAARKKRILLLSGPGTTAITGEKCTPYSIHYTYNNWSLANGTGREVVKHGGDTWFFLTADYAFGKSLEEDTTAVVKSAGGKVLGSARHPSPGTTDFSSFLLQAQSSGAKIIGLANAGGDTINCIKQAKEFGITPKQSLAGLLMFVNDVHGLGLAATKGMFFTTAFYWDRDAETRAWSKRYQQHPDNKNKAMPDMIAAGIYSAVTHYLKAVKAAGTDNADAVAAKMRELPVNDFFARNGRIGPDGLHRHDMYLVQVKAPEESKYPWDYVRVVKTIPAAEAFPTVAQQKCPLAAGR